MQFKLHRIMTYRFKSSHTVDANAVCSLQSIINARIFIAHLVLTVTVHLNCSIFNKEKRNKLHLALNER